MINAPQHMRVKIWAVIKDYAKVGLEFVSYYVTRCTQFSGRSRKFELELCFIHFRTWPIRSLHHPYSVRDGNRWNGASLPPCHRRVRPHLTDIFPGFLKVSLTPLINLDRGYIMPRWISPPFYLPTPPSISASPLKLYIINASCGLWLPSSSLWAAYFD